MHEFRVGLLAKKLAAAGMPEPRDGIAAQISDHILSGTIDDFVWEIDDEIQIYFTDEDADEIKRALSAFIEVQLPELITQTLDDTSLNAFSVLKQRWPERSIWEETELHGFRLRLKHRWGKAFDLLRMLLTISREMGEEANNADNRSKARRNRLRRKVLIRLHARACQVTAEIVTLMENGYADGAMARWRTLHEIGVVAVLIDMHGESIAERYIDHEAIEAKRELDTYIKSASLLGYRLPSKRLSREVNRACQKTLARYGNNFGSDYGWAGSHLGKPRPTFRDLELAAEKAAARSHYKKASYNVHAGVKGILYRLGSLDPSSVLLAGASNAGFEEPGQNVAISLSQITFLLFGTKPSFSDVIGMKSILKLRDQIVREFVLAGRKLDRDDLETRRGQ